MAMNQAEPSRRWNTEALLTLGRSYQAAAVLTAAAELDVFAALAEHPLTAAEVARRLEADERGTAVLLDALAALRLLAKAGGRYALAEGLDALLTAQGAHSLLAITRHQGNCLRRWAQLARVVKTGRPAQAPPSVRGEAGDEEAFIEGMHNLAAPNADRLIHALEPVRFDHLLDVGGASGTWTMAFLNACPTASATLFDRPSVIPLARRRLEAAGFAARVRLVAGDFATDSLPAGADLAWVSAIIHQNSRVQNRALFARIFAALVPGGRIAIRDVVMDAARTHPCAGALFAVNMLVANEVGGTFTLAELRADLEAAGFGAVALVQSDEGMNSLVVARKPAAA